MISVCMIVRDEEAILEKCLQKLKKFKYEIIIVDTGSIDSSKTIAYKYTDSVFDYKWDNSFSNARNFAIKKANNDFILMIDSDEIINEYNKEILEKLCVENEKDIGRITLINRFFRNESVSESKDKIGRLFSRKYYKYEGDIHEQLVPIKNKEVNFYSLPVKVIHYGYQRDEVKRKNKTDRNIKMLKREIERLGENSYLLYQLGKTYYMDNDYYNACEYFKRALDYDLDTRLEYVEDLVECYGYCYINLKKYKEALNFLNIYNEFSRSSDFIFLIALIYMNNGMFYKSIEEFKKAICMKNEKMIGVNSFLSNYNIAVIYECLGEIKEAVKYYKKCDGYELAEKRLKSVLSYDK